MQLKWRPRLLRSKANLACSTVLHQESNLRGAHLPDKLHILSSSAFFQKSSINELRLKCDVFQRNLPKLPGIACHRLLG